MPDSNLPADAGPDVTTPQTFDSQVEDISALLDDSETNPAQQNEDEAAAPAEDNTEAQAEDVENADVAEEADGPQDDYAGGRFAADNAKVRLEDGSVISVADLKRNNLFQRDYTKKTTELSQERETITKLRSEVDQYAQSLNQFRDYAEWYAQNHLPQDPGPYQGAHDDYAGYLEWQQKRDAYASAVQAYQSFQQQKQYEDQRKQGETQKQSQERLAKERDALLKAIPTLTDPVKGPALWNKFVSGASAYGFTPEEVNSQTDHRYALLLRDALQYRALKASAPQVQAQVTKRPPMKSGTRDTATTTNIREKQGRTEQLRKSGRIQDAVSSLMDMDL